MGRRISVFLLFVFCLSLLGSQGAFAAEDKVNIFMENTTVTYSPEGYFPQARAELFANELKYEVTDNATGATVDVPVKAAGSYTVRAYMEATDKHPAASVTASLTVEKTPVYISVTENVAAHTAMDNPVKYSIYPDWAEPFVTVNPGYLAIKDYSDKGTAVSVPKDIGKYLVFFDAAVSSDNISCAGKYLVYEIAEKAGAPLTGEDALRSVPKDFTASIESISAVYSVAYEAPKYHTNIAGIKTTLKYSHLYANGTMGAYTEELPSTPGDYVVSCFALDTVIGSGKLIIDKQAPKIEMADVVFEYTPEGVYPPAATVEPAGIDMVYKAYQYKNGVVGDSVAFPLIECGSYLVSAYPENTSLYASTVAYCTVTIEKVLPVFTAENTVFEADGTPKPLALTVQPPFAEYELSYYQLKDGVSVPLDGAPVSVGEYFATAVVKATDGIEPVTKVYGIRIVEAESRVKAGFATALKIISIAVSFIGLGLGCADILTKIRKRGA